MPPPSPCCLRLFLLVTLASLASAQVVIPKFLNCQPTATAPPPPSANGTAADSTFRANLARLLETLPSSASATGAGGFASLSSGNGGDRAVVRGLCRGDAAMTDCKACLLAAGRELSRNCSAGRRAAIWYEQCSVVFADSNATTAYERRYRQELHNVNSVSDTAAFEKTYEALMSSLSARAVNGPPESPSTAPLFATGHAVFDANVPNGTVYGLVQCMRDRTAEECRQCLNDSVPHLPQCCYGHQGGLVLGYNCNLRMEVYTYYDLALDANESSLRSPPAPAPASLVPPLTGEGTDTKKKEKGPVVLAIAGPIGGALFAVGIITVVFLYKRKAAQKAKTQGDHSNEEDLGFVDQLEQLNLQLLRAATDNFSEENKLGEGGFGEVFRGTLKDGEQIAVKRLSKHSSQGFHELKNELVLAAKLKHKNLAPLVGVCLQQEKLLVYESGETTAAGLGQKVHDHLRDCTGPPLSP